MLRPVDGSDRSRSILNGGEVGWGDCPLFLKLERSDCVDVTKRPRRHRTRGRRCRKRLLRRNPAFALRRACRVGEPFGLSHGGRERSIPGSTLRDKLR